MYFSRVKYLQFKRTVLLLCAICMLLYLLFQEQISGTLCPRLPTDLRPLSSVSTDGPLTQPPTGQHIVTDTEWNLFYHLGGNGPWIPKVDGVIRDSHAPPIGCVVDQVHMLSRHAERYPTKNAGARHLKLLDRFESFPNPFHGSLEFVNTWAYFTDSVTPEFEDLTTSGPYAGTLEAFITGQTLRERYKHLLSVSQPTSFWSCSSPRDIATAEWFANGFFGLNWTTSQVAKPHVIPETSDRGADTLTPSDTCLRYIEDKTSGHDQGYSKLALWQDKFTKPIAHRLSAETGGLAFSDMEIYSMMEMCGFEILVRGDSPWCEVFTKDEWLDFEYARDLLHFYRAGPGNKYAGAMGWLWLNATKTLLLQEGTGGVYFSFVHDGDIIPILATLGIYNGDELLERKQNERAVNRFSYLPTDSILSNRSWRTSDLVPMGGRIIVERLNCRKSTSMDQSRAYIRLVINDGIMAIGDSHRNGMATLESFQQLLHDRGEVVGDFREICGLNDSAPNSITFLHQ